jgi:hypothetical protein
MTALLSKVDELAMNFEGLMQSSLESFENLFLALSQAYPSSSEEASRKPRLYSSDMP